MEEKNLNPIKEVIEFRVRKYNTPEGEKKVDIRFSAWDSEGKCTYDKVFYEWSGEYWVRMVDENGVYERCSEDSESDVMTLEVNSDEAEWKIDEQVEMIIEKVIQERRKYLDHQWSDEKMFRFSI